MKRLYTFLLLLLTTLGVQATNVDFLLTDARLGIGQATNRTVYVQPMSLPSTTSSSVVLGSRLTFITDTNGEFVMTNAFGPCLYAVSVQAPPSRTDFKILVTATNLGTVYAADCLVADGTATFPAGTVAWAASVTDNRYSRTTNNLATYATKVDVTNSIVTFSNQLGSAAFSNSAVFYPTTNPSNFVTSAVIDGLASTAQLAAQGTAITNYVTNYVNAGLTNQGTAITNYVVSQGSDVTNYVNSVGADTTNYVNTVSNELATAFGSSANYQSASSTLTNWSLHSTNDYLDTNTFITFTNLLGTSAFTPATTYQPADVVLSNLVSFGTNFWYPRDNPSGYVTSSVTNGYATITYVDAISNAIVGGAGFQPSSSNLTNWSLHATNDYYGTNSNLQAGSANLTNWSSLSTNIFVTRNNGVATNLFVTNMTGNGAVLTNFYASTGGLTNFYLTNTVIESLASVLGANIYASSIAQGQSNYPQYFHPASNYYWQPALGGVFLGFNSAHKSPMVSLYSSGEVATPDINSGAASVYGTYPAGIYRVYYVGGVMQYSPGGNWQVTDWFNNHGFVVNFGGGGSTNMPRDDAPYTTPESCITNWQGKYVEFSHPGGAISVYLSDNPYIDNTNHSTYPNPTFALESMSLGEGSGTILAADPLPAATNVNLDFIFGQQILNSSNRAYEWRKMAVTNFLSLNGLSTNGGSSFVQTIYATNNPSNIVVTIPSSAFWTNGAEWRCVSGSNWYPTILP